MGIELDGRYWTDDEIEFIKEYSKSKKDYDKLKDVGKRMRNNLAKQIKECCLKPDEIKKEAFRRANVRGALKSARDVMDIKGDINKLRHDFDMYREKLFSWFFVLGGTSLLVLGWLVHKVGISG